MLAGGPGAPVTRGKTVCNCVGVSEKAIADALGGMHSDSDAPTPPACLARLQETLGCGTQCGSCVPEVKRLIAARARA
jgi:assimilatory nitrate reductase catalytic subunit